MSEILWQAYKSGTGQSNSRPQIRQLLFLQIPQGTATYQATKNLHHSTNRGPTVNYWITRGSDDPPKDMWARYAGSDLVQLVMRILLEHGVELDHPGVPRLSS